MKPNWGWVALAGIAGLAIGAWALRADDSYCCTQFANGARDKIAGYAGPFSGAVSTFLDGTGITKLLPGALQGVGYSS